ncbi:MAG TPA: hypothetical protein VJO12_02745 [Stellaceae bacterium]|nr:hypothetical protein [Stellaceae bacterium]
MTGSNWTRAAALALMLAPGLGTVAYADDEYGTGHEAVIRTAAGSVMLPMVAAPAPIATEQFAAGERDNFGAPRRERVIHRSAAYGAVPLVVGVAQAKTDGGYAVDGAYGQRDLVGAGGGQDELARSIYQPGSGTDF